MDRYSYFGVGWASETPVFRDIKNTVHAQKTPTCKPGQWIPWCGHARYDTELGMYGSRAEAMHVAQNFYPHNRYRILNPQEAMQPEMHKVMNWNDTPENASGMPYDHLHAANPAMYAQEYADYRGACPGNWMDSQCYRDPPPAARSKSIEFQYGTSGSGNSHLQNPTSLHPSSGSCAQTAPVRHGQRCGFGRWNVCQGSYGAPSYDTGVWSPHLTYHPNQSYRQEKGAWVDPVQFVFPSSLTADGSRMQLTETQMTYPPIASTAETPGTPMEACGGHWAVDKNKHQAVHKNYWMGPLEGYPTHAAAQWAAENLVQPNQLTTFHTL